MHGKATKILNSAAAFIAIYFESYPKISLSNITAAHDTGAQFQIDTVTSFRNRSKRYTLSNRLHETIYPFSSLLRHGRDMFCCKDVETIIP